MTVKNSKEEILKLIRRVSSSEALAVHGVPEARHSVPRVRPIPRPQTNRGDLEALRQRRRVIEEKLLEGGVPQLVRQLEQRVAAVEAQLQVVITEGPPPRPALPDREAPKSLAQSATPAASPPPADDVLGGKIAEGVLADILQLLSSNMATGLFSVRGDGGEEFQLFFEEGQIVHAGGVGLSGESALFAAMAVERGRFSFREQTGPPPERTIGSKTQFLVLEALRQIDEARAGASGGTSHE